MDINTYHNKENTLTPVSRIGSATSKSIDEPTIEMSQSIPDMTEVLRMFDINPDNLKEVSLENYHWLQDNTDQLVEELTISQRIRTLVRSTRYKRHSQ